MQQLIIGKKVSNKKLGHAAINGRACSNKGNAAIKGMQQLIIGNKAIKNS